MFWTLLTILGVLAALGLLWLWLRRPWAGPRTRYPVVLAHGLLGFDEVQVGGMRRQYFHGVADHLEKLGLEVHRPTVPPIASIARRAEALAEKIRALDAPRVNIVAHSMGGLDARYAIAKLGIAHRVASLTTLGTPHHGTPVADVAHAVIDRLGLGRVLSRLGVEALFELTGERMETFNHEIPNARGVRYGSVVAQAGESATGLQALLVPTFVWLRRRAGENDGLVPVSSQRWGRVLFEIEATHWDQIGWGSRSFDAAHLYERLATRLRRQGL